MENYDPLLLSRRVRHVEAARVSAAEIRSDLWVRDIPGVARPAFVEHDRLTTRLSNAVALMSQDNALGGWATLRAQGSTWFDGTAFDRASGTEIERPVPIHCFPGSQLRVRPQIAPTEALVHPDDTIDLGAYRVATMARAAYDEMCAASGLVAAMIVCDMAVSTVTEMPHTTPEAIGRVLSSHHTVRGIVQARKALTLCSTRSASPAETRTRYIAAEQADLGVLAVNRPVFDLSGSLLGLARVTSDDHHTPAATAARLNAARRDGLSRRHRGWTTELPPWWTSWSHHRRWARGHLPRAQRVGGTF